MLIYLTKLLSYPFIRTCCNGFFAHVQSITHALSVIFGWLTGNSFIRHGILKKVFIAFLLFISVYNFKVFGQQCNSSPVLNVDLSSSPDAVWEAFNITPENSCCDFPPSYNCIELMITLHPEANSVTIAYLTNTGSLWYTISCEDGDEGHIPSPPNNVVSLCFDDPGPHSVVFCRSGNSDYSFQVTSHSNPFEATLNPFSPVCINTPGFFLTGGFPAGGTYLVNGANVFGFFNPLTHGPGDHEITYVYNDPATGCVGSATQTLTVVPLPTIQWTGQDLCDNNGWLPLSGATPAGGYYTGDFVSGNQFNTGLAPPGNYNITYTYVDPFGCGASSTATVTVHPLPVANAGPDQSIGLGLTANLTAAPGGAGTYSYHWEPAALLVDPNVQNPTTVPLNQSQIFTLTVTDLVAGCSSTDQVVVYVTGGDLNIVSMTASPRNICFGESTQLWALVSGGSGNYNYEWSAVPFDASLVVDDVSPVVSPEENTTYTLTLRDNTNPFLEPATASITVNVRPLPNVSLTIDPTVCANTPHFSLTGGSPGGGTYSILNESMEVLNLPYIDFDDFLPYDIGVGNYHVQYEYTNPITGCSNSVTQPLEILPYVKAQFFTYQPFMCETQQVFINNQSVGATSYAWNFGDGNTSTETADNFDYTYTVPDDMTEYTITLTATNDAGCSDTRERKVKVHPRVTAHFTVDKLDGCSPLTVDFTNQSSGNILMYFWDFGDGTFSVEPHPEHTFTNFTDANITYTVTLTVISTTYFCVETHTVDITVYPYIEAGFTLTPFEGCHPLEIAFGNTSTGATSWNWNFGNGDTSTDEFPGNLTYINTSGSIQEFFITQTVANQHCNDEITHTLQVYPEITAAFTPSETIGCAPFEVTFENESNLVASHFAWEFGDGGSSGLENPTHVFENDTDDTIIYTVWLKVRSNNFCKDSVSVDIHVHPRIKADFDFNPAVACNPHEVTIYNTSFGVLTYDWDFGNGTSNMSDPEIVRIYEHDEEDPVTYIIYLEVENAQGCIDTLSRPLTIYPKITADFTPTVIEGCSPLEVFFENNSIGVDNQLWEFGDGGSSVQESPVHIFDNPSYTDVAVFNVYLFNQSEYLCEAEDSIQITVFPRVKADFTISEIQGCSPFFLTIENHSLGASTLNWEFSDGTAFESDDPILTHTFYNTTNDVLTFEIELFAENDFGCIDTLVRTITVFPEVQINYSHDRAGCHPLPVQFENNTENANFYSWTFGDGLNSSQQDPHHIYFNFSHTQDTVFYIELFALSQYGCFASDTSSVRVFPKPDASFQVENSPGCSPHEIWISHNSIGASDYYWDFGDGSGTYNYDEASFSHTYNHEHGTGIGYFNIELLIENTFGCADTLVQQAVIYPNITAAFEPSVIEGCHPLTVQFNNLSTGADADVAFFWDYGNGNTSQNPQDFHSHTFYNYSHTQDATFEVMLIAFNENACSDTTFVEIIVHPKPMAFFSIPNLPACGPVDVNIHNFAVGADSFLWDMGDGDTLYHWQDHFTHTYTQPAGEGPGIYTINLEVETIHGCTHNYSQQIVIYPEINIDFVTDNEGCHVHTAAFENLTVGGHLYHWNFGNGNSSTSTHPQETFLNYSHTEIQTFTVVLNTESHYGCTAQTSQEITVFPKPKAEFSLSELSGCSPFTPEIQNLSIGATSFDWDLGNGEGDIDEDSFFYTWTNTGENPENHTISLHVINDFACEATTSQSITVFPEVTAQFTSEGDIWEGCSPLTIRFLNESHLASSYVWNFSDGNTSTSASPLHTFTNDEMDPVVFPVEMIATSIYGCKDTLERPVTVFPAPIAKFIALPKTQAYPNATITLTNQTNPGYWDFHWEFGDGNNLQTQLFDPFTHTYIWDPNDMSTKTYVVALFASNEHCSDMVTQEVTITSPIPEAEVVSELSGCEPFTVQFYNNSLYAHSYHWDFDDGGYSSDPEPVHTFMDYGIYNVQLVAIGDGGRDTTWQRIEVIQNPLANFELVSTHIHIPEEPLEVINLSELADFYMWHFGDGNTSNAFEPVHYYTEAGMYDITLIVIRDTQPQCFDTLTLSNALRVDETCKIIFPNAFMPNISGPIGGAYEVGNPSTQIFHPVHEGIDVYALEIYNRWGELIYRSDDINVGWDGYVQGKLSKMDVYVWKVTGRCTNGKSIIMAGDVTLYR
jgi:PKD repeat protein